MSKTEDLTKREQSTLLYLETCLVDAYGRVEGRRMNEEDLRNIDKFIKDGIIQFGELSSLAIENFKTMGFTYTYYVRFTDEAWKLAHKFRRERSDRMIGKEGARLLKEQVKKVNLQKDAAYIMNHQRKGPMRVKIIKDRGEFVEVEILKGRAQYESNSYQESQLEEGLGTVGSLITVRKSFSVWQKEAVK